MSLILEALAKAEAERRGGTAQAVPLPITAGRTQASPWRTPWPWIALAALAATLGAAVWIGTRPSPATHEPTAPPLAQAAAPVAIVPESGEAEEVKNEPPSKPQEKPAKKRIEKKPAETGNMQAKATPPATPVGTLRDLPEHIQREIPALSVGGYIYSGSKTDRSVLINKRLVHEGDEIAPGLVLETMQPNGMVLSYKGHRFRAGY